MGRKPLSEEKIQETKDLLFRISNRMIQEKGLESLNIRALCKEAGIAYSSFYQYYDSKDDLIADKIDALDDYILSNRDSRLDSEDQLDNIREFIRLYAEFSGTRRYQIIREIYRIQLTSYTKKEKISGRPFFRLLSDIVQKGLDRDQIRNDLTKNEIIEMILSYCKGMTFEWSLHEGNFNLSDFAAHSASVWVQCLKA